MKDYIKQALVTKSDQFHPDKVSFEFFCDTLATAITVLKDLDKIKKSLFYGKQLHEGETPIPDCNSIPVDCFSTEAVQEHDDCQLAMNQGIDVLHAILGIATEAGELLEALNAGMFGDDGFDLINVAEELGDVFWYQAILANSAGLSFEKLQQQNIDKLRARYGDKFTAFDAMNRDLFEERKVLENSQALPFEVIGDQTFIRLADLTKSTVAGLKVEGGIRKLNLHTPKPKLPTYEELLSERDELLDIIRQNAERDDYEAQRGE